MSRFKRYADSLASGYVLLGANLLYTLASVPLALHYLTTEEFALWALVSQFGGYILLIDAGMASAVSRILIDYKDERTGDNYGSVIKTNFLVTLTQAGIVLLISPVFMLLADRLPGVPPELSRQFAWLMAGQCGLVALNFLTRTFFNILWAHQRTDIGNYAQVVGFFGSLAAQWLSLAAGAGVYATLLAQVTATLIGMSLTGIACWRLGLMPEKGRGGHASWARFRELFSFGKDVFMYALGGQMVNATQVIVVTMCLGLNAAAVWSVCVRGYTLLTQLVWRVLDFSATPLSEMLVHGQTEKFAETFRRITILTTTVAMLGAILFACCNQSFIRIWTHGRLGWSPWNDVLLGVWLVLMAVQRCHCGLMGVRKELRVVKYIYFVEGILFLELGFAFGGRYGFPAIIAGSIVATLILSFRYGLHQSAVDFQLTRSQLWRWWVPAFKLAAVLLPLAVLLWEVATQLPTVAGLGLMAIGIGTSGGWLVVRWGLDRETRMKIAEKLPVLARLFAV